MYPGKERRKDYLQELKLIHDTIEHHIKSDDAKFALVIDKLHDLEKTISNLVVLNTETMKNQTNIFADLHKMVLEHNQFIYGPKDGISIRVDRLESVEESRKFTIRMIWTAIVGIGAKLFYDIIKR